MTKPKLLRLPEVAELTGVPEATWRYWRHEGVTPMGARMRAVIGFGACKNSPVGARPTGRPSPRPQRQRIASARAI